mgnify:CR=1 FL=1
MRPRMRTLATILLTCCLAWIAPAQTPGADSTGAHQDSLQIPIRPIPLVGSVDRTLGPEAAMSAEEIALLDYRTLTDLLSQLPGAFARDAASPGLGLGLTLRAGDARSIAILADGVPLNDPLTGMFNLSLYPTEQIDRIEVIPATRAFLYGRGASGGAVNLVSKSKKALIPQSRIRYSEGANGYGFIDGTVSAIDAETVTVQINNGGLQQVCVAARGIKPGDAMYRPDDLRVVIW